MMMVYIREAVCERKYVLFFLSLKKKKKKKKKAVYNDVKDGSM